MIALTPKLIAYGIGAAGIVAGVLWLRSHWIDVGEARVRADFEVQRQMIEDHYAGLRATDATKNTALSDELALIRKDYAGLRDRAPIVLTQTREVRVSESCTCPAVSLGADFLQHYNAAAGNP